ncbi:MAG: hypothetical protein NT003_03685, partial [Candidatus Magasanikbacteria bacterium]|nr:hypothetical protein [Candidatus Magasanikbacteria bacterium]
VNLTTHEKDKEHSTSAVPLICISKDWEGHAGPAGDVIGTDLSIIQPVGILADVAPTVLHAMGIAQPSEMSGRPLI